MAACGVLDDRALTVGCGEIVVGGTVGCGLTVLDGLGIYKVTPQIIRIIPRIINVICTARSPNSLAATLFRIPLG